MKVNDYPIVECHVLDKERLIVQDSYEGVGRFIHGRNLHPHMLHMLFIGEGLLNVLTDEGPDWREPGLGLLMDLFRTILTNECQVVCQYG